MKTDLSAGLTFFSGGPWLRVSETLMVDNLVDLHLGENRFV